MSKIQKFTKGFENLTIDKDESFDDFYHTLNDIVSISFNMREKMSKTKVRRKILRSVFQMFVPKVTTLEESKDLDKLKLDELICNLQIYKANLPKKKKV